MTDMLLLYAPDHFRFFVRENKILFLSSVYDSRTGSSRTVLIFGVPVTGDLLPTTREQEDAFHAAVAYWALKYLDNGDNLDLQDEAIDGMLIWRQWFKELSQ